MLFLAIEEWAYFIVIMNKPINEFYEYWWILEIW